jgi:hypothetical protein
VNLNGTTEVFEANAGDVDLDGYLYAGMSGNGYTWRKIDINPQRTTYLHAVNWTTNLPDSAANQVKPKTGLDMAFSPRDGKIYSLNNSAALVRVEPTDGSSAIIHQLSAFIPTPDSTGFGAQFMDDQGFFFVSHNGTGNIHRIDLSDAWDGVDP